MKKYFLTLWLVLLVCIGTHAMAEAVFAFEQFSYSVSVKKSVTLQPILQGAQKPEKASYRWTSSDESVAKVSKGKVTGVKAGTAQITCELVSGGETLYETSCEMKVVQPVTKIKPEEERLYLRVGKVYDLHPEVLPQDANNPKLIYTSSDPEIATVSATGRLQTTTRGGKLNIVMEAADGSGVTAKQPVTIVPFVVTAEKAELSERAAYRISLDLYDGRSYVYMPEIKYSTEYIEMLDGINSEDTPGRTSMKVGEKSILIRPIKAGSTSITFSSSAFMWEPACKYTVKITIEPSAIYSKKTFQAFDYQEAANDPQGCIGQPVRVEGKFVNMQSGADYCYYDLATKGEGDQVIRAAVPSKYQKLNYPAGEKVVVYGVISQMLPTTTPTGLTLYTPVIEVEKIDDMFCTDVEIKLDFCEEQK